MTRTKPWWAKGWEAETNSGTRYAFHSCARSGPVAAHRAAMASMALVKSFRKRPTPAIPGSFDPPKLFQNSAQCKLASRGDAVEGIRRSIDGLPPDSESRGLEPIRHDGPNVRHHARTRALQLSVSLPRPGNGLMTFRASARPPAPAKRQSDGAAVRSISIVRAGTHPHERSGPHRAGLSPPTRFRHRIASDNRAIIGSRTAGRRPLPGTGPRTPSGMSIRDHGEGRWRPSRYTYGAGFSVLLPASWAGLSKRSSRLVHISVISTRPK